MNTNKVIADIFREIADILEIRDENKFKIRAYRKASRSISGLKEGITELSQNNSLTDVKGIGKDLAQKIDEYINNGTIRYYEDVKSKVPSGVTEMLKIQGIGPKFVSKMYNEYDIKSIQVLSELLDSRKAAGIKGAEKTY